MGLFRSPSRLTDEQLAQAKSTASHMNERTRLARTALGDNATRVQQQEAAAELERKHGRKGAARIVEEELRKNGAKKRGLFG